jgi:hypothetical protein
MSKITIGGKVIEVPLLNLKKLKRVWPLVSAERIMELNERMRTDPTAPVDHVVDVFVIALSKTDNAMTKDEFEEAILSIELPSLNVALIDLLVENELRKPGEPMPAGDAEAVKSSMETLTPSFAKSSQDSDPLIGT